MRRAPGNGLAVALADTHAANGELPSARTLDDGPIDCATARRTTGRPKAPWAAALAGPARRVHGSPAGAQPGPPAGRTADAAKPAREGPPRAGAPPRPPGPPGPQRPPGPWAPARRGVAEGRRDLGLIAVWVAAFRRGRSEGGAGAGRCHRARGRCPGGRRAGCLPWVERRVVAVAGRRDGPGGDPVEPRLRRSGWRLVAVVVPFRAGWTGARTRQEDGSRYRSTAPDSFETLRGRCPG